MNQYYRAIGFSKIKSLQQLDRLCKEVQRTPDRRSVVSHALNRSLVQLDRIYAPEGLGVSLIGEMDAEGSLFVEYAYPYILPAAYPYMDEIQVERKSDRSGFYGVIDNINLSVVFYLQNIAELTGALWRGPLPLTLSACISGLSLSARILLPIRKTEMDIQYEADKRMEELTNIRLVRRGDNEILERMMMQEMNVKDTLDHRLMSEDVLSIVDSSMIPYGLESDTYDIIGTILQVNETENSQTGEKIILLDVACLYYVIRIAVNRSDLIGEPMVGRRFRGVTWLQGIVSLDRSMGSSIK